MQCRVCDSSELRLAVDLGTQPWSNHFLRKDEIGREPVYPLRVVHCVQCGTLQLDYTIPKETMFGNHTYLSGMTKSLNEHFDEVAGEVERRFRAGKASPAILDIGSNDGAQLSHYQKRGYDVLGVESSTTTAAIANQNGVPTVNRFFNAELVRELGRKFDVISASGVFFHLEELHSVTDGIRIALNEDGVFVVQFIYVKSMVENLAFDQIYHEHLLYYTLRTIQTLLGRHGLEMFDAYLASIHGGSIIGFVGHQGRRPRTERLEKMRRAEDDAKINDYETYIEFARRIEEMKAKNLDFLARRKAEGKRIYGMGAPVKGNALLNYFGIGRQYLDVLVEKNKLRDGLYSPGQHLKVVMEDEKLVPPDVYYVLAWNFKKEILANNQKLLDQGVEFYFPVNPPEPAV